MVEWKEISAEEYRKCFGDSFACYVRADFNLLNESKVEKVRFFAFENEGYRLGIIFGQKGDWLLSPFSAPFGGFSCAKGVTIEDLDLALGALPAFAVAQKKKIEVVFPPVFYNRTYFSKCISSMLRSGFKIHHADLNNAFDLRSSVPYEKILWNMARRNLKTAQKLNYRFVKENSEDGFATCYNVIRQNREFRGYPLKMSLEAFKRTSAVVDMDFLTLYLDEKPVAAAIVYHASKNIFQLIYWGDVPEAMECRPMNMLAHYVFDYYKELGLDYLDIGPSSEDGVPNVGLCAFKESVGCFADLKYAFVYEDV
ncbi:MAG: GNAT family N-acetyltransferase [Fibrobacteraceae bacterium]|nr:GNAT family N-acetyltransferase [Fibrobacteraceae bacterium]